jgi:hypothetical protein
VALTIPGTLPLGVGMYCPTLVDPTLPPLLVPRVEASSHRIDGEPSGCRRDGLRGPNPVAPRRRGLPVCREDMARMTLSLLRPRRPETVKVVDVRLVDVGVQRDVRCVTV